MFSLALEPKDWLLLVSFIVTLSGAWWRIKYQMDNNLRDYAAIVKSITDLGVAQELRYTAIKKQLDQIYVNINKIQTSITVLETKEVNSERRLEHLEKI